MSSSVANAQHLQKMILHLDKSDINFLRSILPCLASSQSLQELFVACDASGVFSGCATHTCIFTFLRAHKHHTLEHTTPITHATYCLLVCLSSITIFIPAVQPPPPPTHTHTYSTFTIRILALLLFVYSTCGSL